EGAGIPWSRVVLDLHSGNLFGKSGRFLVDVTAIGLIVMTFFGIKLLFKGMR
ncbi:MAG: PepSY domain-containing protein, partial [Akkermansiaceae bacterium]|nr:PepSY domain-containing protein [Akkermansiaceae bacterium]